MLKNLPNQNNINFHLERCLSLAISILPNIFFLYAEPQACVSYANGKDTGSYKVIERSELTYSITSDHSKSKAKIICFARGSSSFAQRCSLPVAPCRSLSA